MRNAKQNPLAFDMFLNVRLVLFMIKRFLSELFYRALVIGESLAERGKRKKVPSILAAKGKLRLSMD